MIDAGVDTKSDGLSVKVRLNEAQVVLIQVNNGLSLSQMLLCRLCGLDTNTCVMPADECVPSAPVSTDALVSGALIEPANGQLQGISLLSNSEADCVQTAFENRPELRALSLSADIQKEKVRLIRAEFLPTVALTGGRMGSNPSVFNSFERQFKGMWSLGVVVNIPFVTCGERLYKVKAARAEAAQAHIVNQCQGAFFESLPCANILLSIKALRDLCGPLAKTVGSQMNDRKGRAVNLDGAEVNFSPPSS